MHSQSGEDSSVEAIRNFHVPNDQIPSTFRLLRVQGLPPWANTSCVSIGDVIQVSRDNFIPILICSCLEL